MSETQMKLPQPEQPKLRDKTVRPEGTIPKQAQTYVIGGVALVIVAAVMFSNNHAQPAAKTKTKEPAMLITEANDRKIDEFGQEMSAEQRTAQKAELEKQLNAEARAIGTPAPESTGPQGTVSSSAPQSQPDPLVQHERELAYNSRFASNFAFSADHATDSKLLPAFSQSVIAPTPSENFPLSGQLDTRRVPPIRANQSQEQEKHPANVNVNAAQGQPYVVFEGSELETALLNRLDGDFSGPVKVMVTNPVYSHDRQHILVPEGTFVLGETSKVSGLGQRRLAVVFHRMIMPDGYTVDLDQFRGLNQIGETGLKDKVNNHYFQIFGTSIALGIIAGAAESSNANAGLYQNGSEAYRSGIAASISQSSTEVLDRFLNVPPTITIREGHRVKVYFTQDFLLPAYENHTISPNI
jgi:type IV secretion system protein VirB10